MRQPAPATIQTAQIPAPMGGLNTVAAGSAMPEGDCVQLFNMVAAENGLRSRFGSTEWATNIASATPPNTEIRTLLPFTGSAANGTSDRLFAANCTGIWDVTASSASPTQLVTFGTQTNNAGYGICHGFTTAAGHFLLYCDEENGYYVYGEADGIWKKAFTSAADYVITGVDPALFVFVTSWKSRLWFVEKNSARAWYLPAGAVSGTATQLNLASAAQFHAGGPLVGLWSWTLDGGVGIDDHLVAVSQGGDVAVYKGTDPAVATSFALSGTWNVGAIPAGRNVATNFGGDLLLLTKSGIRPLSQLTAGQDGIQTYATAKIANIFNSFMLTRSELRGWAMVLHPEDNSLVVTVPTLSGSATEQLVLSLWNRSWSRYRDLPILCACVWAKKFYFGTTDSRVLISTGYVDGITLAEASNPTVFTPVSWSVLYPFRNMDGRQKKVEMIRTLLLSDGAAPSFATAARYSFDLSELASVALVASTGPNDWDTGTWDSSVWQGDSVPAQVIRGATGVGTDISVAVRGAAISRTVLIGVEVMFREGGYL